jgi:hypothetical protein
MAMNVVVTSHLPICLYNAAGGKVNHRVARTRRTVTRTRRTVDHYPLCGGPPHACSTLIVSQQRAQGRCFSDLQHFEALKIFHGSSSLRKTI